MRGLVIPFFGSVIGRPVLVRAFRISVTVAVGFFCLRIA